MLRAWLPAAAGLLGALAGGWLAGGFLGLGVVLIVESVAVVVLAFPVADSGERARAPRAGGSKTLAEVLDYQRHVQ